MQVDYFGELIDLRVSGALKMVTDFMQVRNANCVGQTL